MFNRLIRLSLSHRGLVALAALVALAFGLRSASILPVEVLPDLTKPTVVVLTEAPGLAPEEVEVLVSIPLEQALMGVSGVTRLRSTSDVSLSLVFVEFDWNADIYQARQFVQERLQGARSSLPEGVEPYMTPVASLMGEIMLVGLSSPDGSVEPTALRELADWTVRPRLQSLPGIAETLSLGGGIRQIQIQPDPHRMLARGVTYEALRSAAENAASNATGGFLVNGPQEKMVRILGMTTDLEAIGSTVVQSSSNIPVKLSEVANIVWDVEPMRGDAAVDGKAGVIISVIKAPGFDTVRLTEKVESALGELASALPDGVELTALFRQTDFIGHAIGNLQDAIRDGAIMVAIVLFLFLLNFRTTFITLTAIPLSFAIALLVFQGFGLSVNSMTLGGLAVAIGMVVDDAIVDVENVFRRLRQNAASATPQPVLEVIARASAEVRNSILYATVLIILVFLPLLGLSGIEGRLFAPIATATIVSMAASFFVSITVIPVLCSFLLRPKSDATVQDAFLLRWLKWILRKTWLRLALDHPIILLTIAASLLAASLALYPSMGKDFLPAFNEETALVALATAPGTSLRQTNEIADIADRLLREIPEIRSVGRRVGRAERGDHVVPVSTAEFDIDFNFEQTGARERSVVLNEIREKMRSIPGAFAALSGPLADRIGHMLSGVSAKVAIKVFGPDLAEIRRLGEEIQAIARSIPGLEEARVEQQAPIPQLRIDIDRTRAFAFGVEPGTISRQISALLGGEKITELYQGQRFYDLILRLPPSWRESTELLAELPIYDGQGRTLLLGQVAQIREGLGPNTIQRENAIRRFVVSINPTARDLSGLVDDLQERTRAELSLPPGYSVQFDGEFQAQRDASRRIAWLSAISFSVIAFLLYNYFRTSVFAIQVLCDIPLALVGGLALTWIMLGNISIATLVGFIAVAGVAARNSVMLISHYLRLMRQEGESFTREMVERGTLERLAPVLMTALSASIALVPLLLSSGQPGKEILHPVAVVIVGGLTTSTLLGLGVTPAIFYAFGRRAAERSIAQQSAASE